MDGGVVRREDDKKKKKKKKEGKVKLSFAMDGEEEDGEDSRASVGRKVVESAQASAEGTPTGDDEDGALAFHCLRACRAHSFTCRSTLQEGQARQESGGRHLLPPRPRA